MKTAYFLIGVTLLQCRQDPIPNRQGRMGNGPADLPPNPNLEDTLPNAQVVASNGENRGVWISNVGGVTFRDPKQLLRAVALSAQTGLNTLYPVTYNRACTFYVSSMLKTLAGIDRCPNEGLEGRDPLKELAIEAKSRGFRVIPWFEWGVKLLEGAPLTNALMKQNFVTSNVFGCRFASSFGMKIGYLNIFNKEAQAPLIGFLKEHIENYMVDGIQIDDHIAFTNEVGYDPQTLKAFADDVKDKKLNFRLDSQNQIQIRMKLPLPPGAPTDAALLQIWNSPKGLPQRQAREAYDRWVKNKSDPQGGTAIQKMAWEWATNWDARDDAVWTAWLEWRRSRVTEFMKRLVSEIKALAKSKNRNITLSLSPHSPRWSFEYYSQDWVSWLKEGLLDEVVVQNYQTNLTNFNNGLKAISDEFKNNSALIKKISIGLYTGSAGDSPTDPALVQQAILAARKMNFGGVAFFYFDSLGGLTGDPNNPKKQLYVRDLTNTSPTAQEKPQLKKFLSIQLGLLKPGDILPYQPPPPKTGTPALAKLPFNPQNGCFDE